MLLYEQTQFTDTHTGIEALLMQQYVLKALINMVLCSISHNHKRFSYIYIYLALMATVQTNRCRIQEYIPLL